MAGFGDEPDLAGPQVFTVKGLAPEAKAIASLKGTARLSFPLARTEVKFEDPQGGAKTSVGDITILLERVMSDKIKLEFSKPKGDVAGLKEEILGRLDAASVIVVDESGKEHAGEILPAPARDGAGGGIVIMGGGMGGEAVRKLKFQATFPNLSGKDIKQFRFRFSDAVFEKSVPFELKDVKLP